MMPKNPGTSQKGTQKSCSNPQKSTQNNGTSLYHNIYKLPPPPPSLDPETIVIHFLSEQLERIDILQQTL